MSDIWGLLREKELGKGKIQKIQEKAFSSSHIYKVLCFHQKDILATFVVRGVKKERLMDILSKFLYFHINSEGSGEFYFKKELTAILDKEEGVFEPIQILDYNDVPFTSFELEKVDNY